MKIQSLCGKWDFGTVTVGNEKQYVSTVNVPGNWQEEPGLREFVGTAWYKKSFHLSEEDAAKHLALRFGGVFRRAEVWLNGQRLAFHDGYQAPFRVDIANAAICGENNLEVRVDNERLDGPLGNGSIMEITSLPVAGIYEPVTLEFSEKVRVTAVYTPIDLASGSAIFLLTAENDTPNAVDAVISLSVGQEGNEIIREVRSIAVMPGESEITVTLPLDRFQLWSPEDPVLYDVAVTVSTEDSADTFTTRTGLKHLEARGREFYLNGRPYYLLGFGDDFVYPMGTPSALNKAFYFHGIRRAKEYGFNYVRHHSNVPFEAYLDAADELGLLIQPELALANIPRERFDNENKQWFVNEWQALIRAYRHHPCIALWCGGNEMEWGFPFDKELYDTAKALDPYRLAASTDGNFMACDAGDSMDFVSICAAEYTDYLPWRELSDLFLRDDSGKPQFVHEMGNYTTLPTIRDLPKYDLAQVRPQNLENMASLVRETGKEALYDQAYSHALALHKLCHKLNIEKARLSPLFCGYHVWTLTDYYETTQGLLNAFYEDKAFTAEEFSRINRQEVLLWDTDRVVFTAGEEAEWAFKLSRFGSDDPLEGTLAFTLSDGQSQQIVKRFAGHGILEADTWRLTLPAPAEAREYTLTASFVYAGGEIQNSWTVFVCPAVAIRTDKEIYINYLSRHLFAGESVPLRHFTTPQPIGKDQLIVSEYIYDGMLSAVERGASMLLLAKKDTFRHTVERNSFKSPWWSNGPIWYLNHTNNDQVCGIVESHPATRMIPYDGCWKLDLFGCVEQAHAIDLDALGLDVDSAIHGIGTDLHRRSYLFEFRLGVGRMIVCTLNHSRADMADPATAYTIKSLINYAMSPECQPKTALTQQQFQAALQEN